MILTKNSNVSEAIVGDIITYTLTAENNDTFNYTSAIIKDLLTPDLNFVEGSVIVDGITLATASILSGIEVGPIPAGSKRTLEFKAQIVGNSANPIINTSTAYYTYLNSNGQTVIATEDSNPNSIDVYLAEIQVTKTASTSNVSLSDPIIYTVTVANVGNTDAYTVIFKDLLPAGLKLVPGSFKVGTTIVNDVNLTQGVDLGAIPAGSTVTLQYQVTVTGGSCSGFLCNKAYVTYNYVQPNGVTGNKQSNMASACVEARITSFKQLILDKYCEVPCVKPNIEDLNDEVTVDIQIENSYVVQTIEATSIGGQHLSGYKLIVHGNIFISIEYTACLESQPVHSYHCELPFGTFIILPPDYTPGQQVEVNAIVENVEADMAGPRGVFTNITLLIVARVN